VLPLVGRGLAAQEPHPRSRPFGPRLFIPSTFNLAPTPTADAKLFSSILLIHNVNLLTFDFVVRKADVNLHDGMGRHALHLAAEADSVAAVQFLVTDIGVNVNLQTVLACDTALHFAAKVHLRTRSLLTQL